MNKLEVRAFLRLKRDLISQKRRKEAAHHLLETLYPLLQDFAYVLSFNSFPKEIDLSLLNLHLQKENRVLLKPALLGLKKLNFFR